MPRYSFILVACVVFLVSSATAAQEEIESKTRGGGGGGKPRDIKGSSAFVTPTTGWDLFLAGNTSWLIVIFALKIITFLIGIGILLYYYFYISFKGYSGDVGTDTPDWAARFFGDGSLNFARILDLVSMAQETYENLDLTRMDCQKKLLCEVQEKQEDLPAETARRVSDAFSLVDSLLRGFPVPAFVQEYVKGYKDAMTQGRDSSLDCGSLYPGCGFSIRQVYSKYTNKLRNKTQQELKI